MKQMKKIKILIVDDHQLFSEALKGLIEDKENFEVIDQLVNGKEVQDFFSVQNPIIPDLVLMDVQMPIINGIDATKWLNEKYPDIKILALTMDNEENTILKMLRAGAKGYLLKDIHPSILHQAIEETVEKGFYYTEQVNDTLLRANKVRSNPLNKVELKPRELELLKYACQEMTYKEIAEKMFLSPKTIDGYRERLFVKLDVKSRIGLVLYAIKEKII